MTQINTTSATVELCERCKGNGSLWVSELKTHLLANFSNPHCVEPLKEINCSFCHGSGRLLKTEITEYTPFSSKESNVTPLFKEKEV